MIGLDSSSWPVVQLSDCAEILSGGTPSKSEPEFWGGSTPWVSAKDMKIFRLHDAEDHVTPAGAADGTRTAPAGSTLVLVRGMTLHDHVPICWLMRDMAFNQDVKAIVPKKHVDPEYLAYWLAASGTRLHGLVDAAGHGTGRIGGPSIRDLPVRLPPLEEQRSIAHSLGAIDCEIELNRTTNYTLESMARAVFKSWFVDFEPVRERVDGGHAGLPPHLAALFPNSLATLEGRPIPSGWRVTSLGELFPRGDCVLTGPFGSTLHSSDYRSEGVPLVLVKHVVDGRFVDNGLPLVGRHKLEELRKYRLSRGDIVFTRVGAVGRSALVRSGQDGWLFSGQTLRVRIPNREVLEPEYLSHVFLDPAFISLVESSAVGSTRPSLNTEMLKSFKFVLPDHAVQLAFADLTSSLMALRESLFRGAKRLATVRGVLLPELLAGRLSFHQLDEDATG